MADKKITQLTTVTTVEPDQLLLIVDNPDTTPVSKQVTVEKLWASAPSCDCTHVDAYAKADTYNKTEVDENTYTKAAVDTNTYTKAEVDANTYTKTEVDTNTYTKAEVDAAIAAAIAAI